MEDPNGSVSDHAKPTERTTRIAVSGRDLIRWVLIPLAAAVLGGSFAWMFSSSQEPVYESGVKIAVMAVTADRRPIGALDAERLVNTQLDVLNSRAVLDRAVGSIESTSVTQLDRAFNATGAESSDVLDLRLRAAEPELARARLSVVLAAYVEYVATEVAVDMVVRPLGPPSLPTSPVSPRTTVNVAVGAVLAAVCAACALYGSRHFVLRP